MTKRRWIGIALLVIVLLAAGALLADEMRLRHVTASMTKEQVLDALGQPSERIDRMRLRAERLPIDTACARSGIDEAYVYRRRLRNSLFVYFVDGRVQCTERNFSIVQY